MSDDMAHLNRRSEDSDDGQRHRVLELVEGTSAKFIARVIVPVLLSVLVVISGFVGKRLLSQLDSQGNDIAQVKSDIRVLGTRFDEVALRQVSSNTDRIRQMEAKDIDQDQRIDRLEHTVKTP